MLRISGCFFILFTFLTIQNCRNSAPSTLSRPELVELKAKDYFATFAERKDWDKLCSFYRDDVVFDDIMLQLHLDSLWQLKRFYKWDEEGNNFRKLTPDQDHLTIYSLVVNDSLAIGYGRINPFYYYERLIDVEWGMNAAFWLYFDKDYKIKKQIDWIEYDSDVLESVIKRYREKGVDLPPDWLDLSK